MSLPCQNGEEVDSADEDSDVGGHNNEEAIATMIRLAEEAEENDSEGGGAVAPPRG